MSESALAAMVFAALFSASGFSDAPAGFTGGIANRYRARVEQGTAP